MKGILIALLLSVPIGGLYCQEKEPEKKLYPPKKKCEGCIAPRNATVLSMMGWGVAIAVGIATLCVLLKDNPESALNTTSTNSTNTNTGT